jgi:hypothetical protein
MTKGRELGRAKVVKIWRSPAPKQRAHFSSCSSMVRTPASVFTRIGKKAPRKTTAIFDSTPIPSHKMRRGKSATRGVAYKADTKGSKIAFRRRYQPKRMPRGIPAKMATP